MLHLYFDMDGVLVYYDESHSVTKPFNVPGKHYFRTCQPDETAVELARVMSLMPDVDVKVLTRVWLDVADRSLLNQLVHEHALDKYLWCEEHLDFRHPETWKRQIMQEHYICHMQTTDKSTQILSVPEAERKYHVLIDDDPRMLDNWVSHGGSGVQFLQPDRKVKPWNGPIIRTSTPVHDAMQTLLLMAPVPSAT